MLNLINVLTLTTALYTNYNTSDITININKESYTITINTNLTSNKEYAFNLLYITNTNSIYNSYSKETYSSKFNDVSFELHPEVQYIALGWLKEYENITDIAKYKEFNEYTTLNQVNFYYNVSKIDVNNTSSTIKLNISEKETPMEELLTALTTAVQSAVTIFVEGFGGLTQIFYNGSEITFIGGILIIGLAIMFLMMFLRWIVSFVKGI